MADRIEKWLSKTGREYRTEAEAKRDEDIHDMVMEIEAKAGLGNMDQAVAYILDHYTLAAKPEEELPNQDIPFGWMIATAMTMLGAMV